MPLLTSPIDGSPMRQINRFGIELDVCPTSGGVWLDKGELEKIIQMIKEASEEERSAAPQYSELARKHLEPPRQRNHDDDDYKKYGHSDQGRYKKKSKFSMLSDLFDF